MALDIIEIKRRSHFLIGPAGMPDNNIMRGQKQSFKKRTIADRKR